MRIYGNREIRTLEGLETRPTTGKVRMALFNMWRNIRGSSWCDLCAGNGSLGAEALCRGAAEVIGIEQSGIACRLIQENWQKIARSPQTFEVIRGDVLTCLGNWSNPKFDWIYFDPPYASDLYVPVLKTIAVRQLLKPSGAIAVEHDPKRWQAEAIEGLNLYRQRQYGKTMLSFYEVSSDS